MLSTKSMKKKHMPRIYAKMNKCTNLLQNSIYVWFSFLISLLCSKNHFLSSFVSDSVKNFYLIEINKVIHKGIITNLSCQLKIQSIMHYWMLKKNILHRILETFQWAKPMSWPSGNPNLISFLKSLISLMQKLIVDVYANNNLYNVFCIMITTVTVAIMWNQSE